MIEEDKLNSEDLKEQLRQIKFRMVRGELTYEQAKELAQPIVDGINWLVMDICFKYNKRIKTYSFHELIKGISLR